MSIGTLHYGSHGQALFFGNVFKYPISQGTENVHCTIPLNVDPFSLVGDDLFSFFIRAEKCQTGCGTTRRIFAVNFAIEGILIVR